jgi:hypothetical protein
MDVGQTLTLNDAVTYEASAAIASVSTLTAVGAIQDPLSPSVAINAVSTLTAAAVVSTAPTLSGGILDTGPDPDELDWTTDQNGTLYWAVFPVAATPTAAQIIAGGDYKAGTIVVTGLTGSAQLNLNNVPNGNFEIHAILQNAGGANSNIVETAVTVSGNTWPVAINGVSTLTVSATVVTRFERSAAIASVSTLTATATVTAQRTAAITSVSTLTAAAITTLQRTAAIGGLSTLTAAATVVTGLERSVAIASASTMTASATRSLNRTGAIASASNLTVARLIASERSASIVSASSLTAVGSVTTTQIERSAAINGSSTFTAASTSNLARACQIFGQSQLDVTAVLVEQVNYGAEPAYSGLGGNVCAESGRLGGTFGLDLPSLRGYVDQTNRHTGRVDHG